MANTTSSSGNDPKKYIRTRYPGVYSRGNRYVYKYRDQHNKLREGSEPTIRKAVAKRNEELSKVENGTHQVKSKLKFAPWAREMLQNYTGRTKSGFRDTTRDSYLDVLENHLVPFFGNRKLDSIRTPDIRAFLNHMNGKPHPRKPGRLLGASTIRYTMQVLKVLFAQAVEDGTLQRNPAQYVRVIATPGPGVGREMGVTVKAKALTREQLSAFLRQLDNPGERLLFELLVETGMRIGELLALRWVDLDLDGPNPTVHVTRQLVRRRGHGLLITKPKSAYGVRDIPLSPRMAAKLLARAGQPDELVFSNSLGGFLDRPNWTMRVLKPAASAAGVGWAGFHTFRHTCASLLFASQSDGGGERNVKQVQEWLGHATPGFTLNTYVHLMDAGVGDADFFDGII